ncbi:MAG: FAD-binding dehydrogenase, partial [Armatimonadetes bacterium]|nr:FAD-binding dehydrogenase [Armatimonadota bacterium]
SGLVSVHHHRTQEPPEDIGVETFECWSPGRRPAGRNLALRIEPPLALFGADQVVNGLSRPTAGPNAWVADPADTRPALTLTWGEPQVIGRVELTFDCDWDHAMESVLMGHPERAMPFCVRHYRLLDGAGNLLHECRDNYQTRRSIRLPRPVTTSALVLECLSTWGAAPAALFELRCYHA